MPRVIITALVLLAALVYAVLFTTWNMEPVKVVGWRMGSQQLWEAIPLAYVALAGVAVGVLAMVLATLCAWLGQRGQIKKMQGQIERAKEVLVQQRKRIEELEAALQQAQQELEQVRAREAEETLEVEVGEPVEQGSGEQEDSGAAGDEGEKAAVEGEDDEEII